MNTEALIVAATPCAVFIGAAISYYCATENGNRDPVPRVRRGDSSFEPWGVPEHVRTHIFPGSTLLRLPPDQALKRKHDTAQFARVHDERGMTHGTAPQQR